MLTGMPAPTYSEAELHAAVEALADADRFYEAERVVAAAAPGLQKVLAEALASGGWFEESHQGAIGDAAGRADESERVALISTLIAEESRLAMMIGVAVGWALAGELSEPRPPNDNEERETQ
jgi:hypothetical protein